MAALAGGCAKGPEPVWVDLDQVTLKRDSPVARHQATTLSVDIPPETANLPQVDAKSEKGVDTIKGNIEAKLENDRKRAVSLLQKRLEEVYGDELKAQAKLKSSDDQRKIEAAANQIPANIRALLESYGPRRAGLLLTISELSGFPDPNPQGTRQLSTEQLLSKSKKERLAEARSDLTKLDAELSEKVAKIEGEPSAVASNLRAGAAQALAVALAKVSEQAAQTARRQVGEGRPVNLALDSLQVTTLACPPDQVQLTNVPPTAVAAQPNKQPIAVVPSKQQALSIWMASQGYKLGSKGSSRNVTADFQAWIDSYHLGH